ncbi:MAG: GTPase HflX [Actinomycetota bacterium]|nr:GTPase HflX [Actinomycetota bacterium]
MTKEKTLLIFTSFNRFRTNKKESLEYPEYTPAPAEIIPAEKDGNVEELKNLTESAGAEVTDILYCKQEKPDSGYFISRGKLEEAVMIVNSKDIELVVFDDEITPSQQRNLQSKLNTKVIDRTALILDIFAQRAHTSEGKLQVELAQLNYLLPRLTGKGVELSRLGGGIGTRGPGETKLEVDRRKIRKRISQLKRKINQIGIQRDIQRKKRDENVFKIALAGYTNSGKTTLLNTTTDADAYVEDRLFSTLDSTTRKINISPNYNVLISDTVGFIEKLPHQLIASFKSTLEEVKRADLLLIVVDISKTDFESNILSVKEIIKEIDADKVPSLLVFNKIDKLDSKRLDNLMIKYKDAIFISALKKTGISDLYSRIRDIINKQYIDMTVKVPYSDVKTMSFIYNNCYIKKRKDIENNAILNINVNLKYAAALSEYIYREAKKDKKMKQEEQGRDNSREVSSV